MGQAMVDCIFFSSSNGLACYRIAMESRFEPKDGGGEKTDDLSSTSVRSRHILVVQQITTVGGNLISADWAGWVCEEPLCLLACSCRVVSGERRDLSISAILRGENCVVRASRSVWRMSQRSWMLYKWKHCAEEHDGRKMGGRGQWEDGDCMRRKVWKARVNNGCVRSTQKR
jgi:hypothetical protein